MSHTPQNTYHVIVKLAATLAMGISVDWKTNVCIVTPRGLSAELNKGRALQLNLEDTSPEEAQSLFGRFFGIGDDRVAEMIVGTSPTLKRRSRRSLYNGKRTQKHTKENDKNQGTSREGSTRRSGRSD